VKSKEFGLLTKQKGKSGEKKLEETQ